MESSGLLRLLYIFFLGVLLALFVGIGINTFYPPPKAPEYPVALMNNSGKEPSAPQLAAERAYQVKVQQHDKEMQPYNRNVSIMALVSALALFVVSIVFEKHIQLIADGLMLGGIFTMLYSIGRGLASQDSKYMFIVVTVGLVIALYLGFRRFVRPAAITDRS